MDLAAASGTQRAEAVAARALALTADGLCGLRRTGTQLQPGVDLRETYEVQTERGRRLLLVARAWADAEDSVAYAARCREHLLGAAGDPVQQYLELDDATRCAWWFAPNDPCLPTLREASDPAVVRPLLAPRFSARTTPARVEVDTLRYLPGTKAVLRYRVTDRRHGSWSAFGKLYADGRGPLLQHRMRALWDLSQDSDGRLHVVEPIRYDEGLALHLEHPAPGQPVTGDRQDPLFLQAAVAAADALAALHDSGMRCETPLDIGPEVLRLRDVVTRLRQLHPRAGSLLRDLLDRVEVRLRKTPPEERCVTHGDLKYDQLLHHDGRFTLVDFEEMGTAETSWDLGKWCAHAMPSMPREWEESQAAEDARQAFLERYLASRPQATVQRFPAYEAVHLANRAMVLMWGQRDGWGRAAESLLTLAMERLHAQPLR